MAAPRRRPVWSRLREGSGGTVTCLAAAPYGSGSSAVLAGTLSGLFLSPDAGQTWQRAAGGLGAPYVQSAAVSPAFATDHTLLVGTVDASAFVSVDGGATWRDTFFWGATASVTSAAFSPQYASDRLALVGTESGGVYVSANLGRTWNAQNDGLDDQQVLAVAVSPGPPHQERVLAGTESGLYMRARGASAWRLADDCAKGFPIQALEFVAHPDAYTAYAATEGAGLYRTTTNGLTWQQVPEVGASTTVNALVISPNYGEDGTVFIATAERGLLRTSDRGETWEQVGNIDGRAILTLTLAESGADWTLLAGLYEGGVWRSDDRGQSWQRSDDGLASRPLLTLAASPSFADDGTLIAGTADEGLLYSHDAGRTWSPPAAAPDEPTIASLAMSPDDQRTLAIAGPQVLESTDGGRHWDDLAGLPETLSPASLTIGAGGRLAIGGGAGDLHLSDDGGSTWRQVAERFGNGRLVAIAFSPRVADDGTIFVTSIADGRIRLYHTRDAGVTWVRVFEKGARGQLAPIAVPPNYRDARAFVGVVAGRDVFTPNGPRMASWVEGRVSVDRLAAVTSLVVSPNFGRTGRFYAGTGLGLFHSRDKGHTWSPTGGRDAPTNVTCVTATIEASGAEAVFAGTLDGDVWRRGPRESID
ncbi:MAG: hypothetical protein OXU21_01865 [Chloroflexota bacterium]|nr:hypothetical protein [Chloroflexota bacterium]